MPSKNAALFPTPKLRAHRPRTDALQQPSGDVQEDVYTEDLPKRPGLLATYWKHIVAGMWAAWVFARGRITEQDLRMVRFHHHVETPLDDSGEPVVYREGWQANPHRR